MKTCKQCGIDFPAKRKDKEFCSKTCVYKHYNDLRPRKTSKSYIKADEKKKVHIPGSQMNIIRGCLMGDASLILQTDGHYRMSLCHCEAQRDYIEFKREFLSSIFMQSECNRYDYKGHVQFHCHSISHKDLTNLYGEVYRNKKKLVTRKFLNTLTIDSLLFWFLDDGSNIKASGHAAIFCTDSFSLSEVKAIKIWLWQKFRIQSNISESRGSFNDHVYHRIRLNKAETIKLFNLLSTSDVFNVLPESMMYKFKPYL